MKNNKTYNLTLMAIMSALVIAMTVIPYTGYISYGSIFEITTLHIVVILSAVTLGWKGGAFVGGVWGVSCMLRALTNPFWIDFVNPLISLLPRIAVGVVAALSFACLVKFKVNKYVSATVSAFLATATNTILVLLALNYFGGSVSKGFFETFGTILKKLVSINGVIELTLAMLLIPVLYRVIDKVTTK